MARTAGVQTFPFSPSRNNGAILFLDCPVGMFAPGKLFQAGCYQRGFHFPSVFCTVHLHKGRSGGFEEPMRAAAGYNT